MVEFIEIAPLSKVLTHTRFLLTLRSAEGVYHSLLLFRLASSEPSQNTTDTNDDGRSQITSQQIYVMESACPHLGADMSHADIEEYDETAVAVCPWHRYDFDLRTGKSDTGLKACIYDVQLRESENVEEKDKVIWIEAPEGSHDWLLVEFRPVSEAFADPPPQAAPTVETISNTLSDSKQQDVVPSDPPKTLIQWAVLILNTANPQLKVDRTRHAVNLFRAGKLMSIGCNSSAPRPPDIPPREDMIKTVDPGHAPKRKSRVAMLHALANIEQWAIDLAWDIVARFGPQHPRLPQQFFSDWTKVALDESKHFTLLCERLRALGSYYGELTVHAGLWQSAEETKASLRARLAIIHLVHEARGLDVNPQTIERFRRQGDLESVEALEIIHHDEITHVTAGHRWFTYICAEEGVDPVQTFRAEVRAHFVGGLKPPFNEAARSKAGLTGDYYENLRDSRDGRGGGEAKVGVAYDKP